jgi:hypothetical protein
LRKQKSFENYPSFMSHFIEETKGEINMARSHNRRISVYIKE